MKYKILVIKLLLKNNELASYGDLVVEDQLTDTAEKLLKEGFIEEVIEKPKTAAQLKAEQKAADELKAKEDQEATDALKVAQEAEAAEALRLKTEQEAAEALILQQEIDAEEAAKKLTEGGGGPNPEDILKK